MSGDTGARVTELEARYTLQADLLQKLSDVLWEQQKTIDLLTARITRLEERLKSLGEAETADDDDPPPHY